jgi:hypothetical protein
MERITTIEQLSQLPPKRVLYIHVPAIKWHGYGYYDPENHDEGRLRVGEGQSMRINDGTLRDGVSVWLP